MNGGRRNSRDLFTSVHRCVRYMDSYLTKRSYSHRGRAHARYREKPCYKCTSTVSVLYPTRGAFFLPGPPLSFISTNSKEARSPRSSATFLTLRLVSSATARTDSG